MSHHYLIHGLVLATNVELPLQEIPQCPADVFNVLAKVERPVRHPLELTHCDARVECCPAPLTAWREGLLLRPTGAPIRIPQLAWQRIWGCTRLSQRP